MSRKFVYTKTKTGPGSQPLLTLFEDGRDVDCFSSKKLAALTRLAADWMLGVDAETIARRWGQGSYHQENLAKHVGKGRLEKIQRRALTDREDA